MGLEKWDPEGLEERLDIISKVSKLPESKKICEELIKLHEITGRSAPNTVRAIAAGFIMKRFSAEDSIEMANITINFYNLFFKGIDKLD